MDNLDYIAHSEGYGPRQMSYSNKYYDYEKAHEYYERTKKLKGRQPANQEETADNYLQPLPSEDAPKKSAIGLDRRRRERYSAITNRMIARLKNSIEIAKTIENEDSKKAAIQKIQNEIALIRDLNNRMRSLYSNRNLERRRDARKV